MTIKERTDPWQTTWYWTAKDDETTAFVKIGDGIFATELASQCTDFRALVLERLH